jgi:CheY-like chemotaxis protein
VEPVWVDADLTRLSQVVLNLLANAAKYTPDGGRISLALRCEGGDAVLRVTDTGLGIPKEMLSEVFEMFTQVNHNLDRSQGGLGIGLALVRRLVGKHGGSIEAESDGPGRGSRFTVRLPTLPGKSVLAESPSAASNPAAAGAAGRLRVLIVDDNQDAAESLSLLLQLGGHSTRIAFDGPEALEAFREFLPDVVFLDIGLPGMSGHEVARRMREGAAAFRPVLVALTGWGTEEDKRKSHAAGFDFHLTKPADDAAVQGVLRLCASSKTDTGDSVVS